MCGWSVFPSGVFQGCQSTCFIAKESFLMFSCAGNRQYLSLNLEAEGELGWVSSWGKKAPLKRLANGFCARFPLVALIGM